MAHKTFTILIFSQPPFMPFTPNGHQIFRGEICLDLSTKYHKWSLGSISRWDVFDIIILTMVTTIMLYLDEIIKFILMNNSFISIMKSKLFRRLICDLVQCVNHKIMYYPNLMQNISGLIHSTSSITLVQLFSHSSHYLSSSQI